MGFIYSKPLSLEQIFSIYNNKGGDKIDKEEAANAKNIKIFEGFVVQEGWTLQDFERENLETYQLYEKRATGAWTNQQREVHIKYLRVHFGIKEGSADDIKDGESVEDFEVRLLNQKAKEDYKKAVELEKDSAKSMSPKFGFSND